MGRGRRSRTIAALAVGAALLATAVASAQLPGEQPASFAEPARIAFATEAGIRTIAADGSGRSALIADGYQPSWSPDGRSIAFVRFLDDEQDPERSEIWVANSDGSGARALTKAHRGWEMYGPTWSPDGRRVGFVRVRFGKRIVSTLLSVAAEGGDERRIAELASSRYEVLGAPAWSPDGNSLLVSRTNWIAEEDDDENARLYLVNLADGRLRQLRRGAKDAAWSPAGDRIAYVGERPDCEGDYCYEVYVANADGGGRRRLTTNDADDGRPSWSADGQRIAFDSTRNSPGADRPEIYSIQPDGNCLTWLTNGSAESFDPAWQPGANRPTDPGGCGATPREPVLEADISEVERYKRAPLWWFGPRFGNLLLTGSSVEDGTAFLDYGDCASYEPADCETGFSLSAAPVCTSFILFAANARTVSRHGGALVTAQRFVEEDAPTVYTGTTVLAFEGPERMPTAALDSLRRFGEDAPPAGGLPRAELPLRFWRSLEKTRAAVKKYGSANARRRLGLSRGDLRDRLSLDGALRKLGPFGRLDCGR